MGKTGSNAFTLIELLVVIAVMALTGTVILANYRSFGEDQKLRNAVLDIQSLLRSAQTNATANTKCNSQNGATWQVEFIDAATINLKCQEPAALFLKKTLKLDTNIAIDSKVCPAGESPSTISFAPLGGRIDFAGTTCASLTVTLKNNKTGNTKSLKIEPGGRIYEP